MSVIVPTYNQAHILGETIESVLAQTYPRFELLVVDDGSVDNTGEIVTRYPGVRYIRQENAGCPAARNSGANHGKGEYLVFLDGDDRLLPDALRTNADYLDAHRECALVAGHRRLIAADGSLLGEVNKFRINEDDYAALLRRCYIRPPATAMIRRAAFDSVGGFDASLRVVSDYDLYLRIARNFPIHTHGKVVAEYRQHSTNASNDIASMLGGVLTVLRRQRKHVKGNRLYEELCEARIRSKREKFGSALANEVRTHVLEGEWKQAIQDLLVLLRYYPRGWPYPC